MRVITITTKNYVLNAARLVKSLKRAHPDCEITVYSDCVALTPYFSSIGASFHLLPEIESLGVKRAKFSAYAHASKNGGFIYLDADILVLQPLAALLNVSAFTACRDDLSECPFIVDRYRPWENHPEWTADQYFNSGVFAVPAGFDQFFERIRQESKDDQDWDNIVIQGKLHDNHYLCAKLVQHRIDVSFISEYEHNWQGFRRFNQLNCYVDEAGILRNKTEQTPLRLVHFAGVKNIDAYIAMLPSEIARVLTKSIGEKESGILEVMNAVFCSVSGIEERHKLQLIKSMVSPLDTDSCAPGVDQPLLNEAAAVTSIALSTTETDFLWNGLRCGASYLSAVEYKSLRDFVQTWKVNSVLEFGAGYTTDLFRSLVKKQVALEGWDGPWLEFSRAKGCDARLVNFSSEVGFDDQALQLAVKDVFLEHEQTMVFIDSPPGTANRAVVVDQVIQHAHNADFYVVHDSVRDSENVYRLAATLGLHVMDHLPSWRGLTFLGKKLNQSLLQARNQSVVTDTVRQLKFKVSVVELASEIQGMCRAFLKLENTGELTIPTGGEDALRFSLHLIGDNGDLLAWDTTRYSLPVDLAPADAVSFWVEVPSTQGNVVAADCDFVNEGAYWWSRISNTLCPRIDLR